MKVIRLQGLDPYDIYMQDFLYEDTRLFAFHNRRDLSKDEQHAIEYGFYKGVFFHDSSKVSVEPYYFSEKNVFALSGNGSSATLYYMNYSDDNTEILLHRLNCRTKESVCFSTRNFNWSTTGSAVDLFNLLTFVGINERYVFISFHLGQERIRHFYIVDSFTGEWLFIAPDSLLSNLELFSIWRKGLVNYIVIKTGQYLSAEKERWYANHRTDLADEHMVVVEDHVFIEAVRKGSLDLSLYVMDSWGNDRAQAGYFFDSNEIVYYTNHFDSSTTSVTRYDPLTSNKATISFNGIHFVRYINKKYYSVVDQEDQNTLYDLETGKDIVTFQNPDRFMWMDDDRFLSCSFLPDGNMRLTSRDKRTHQDSVLGKGICHLEVERDIVTIIERTGL
ncbi:hypothetical protein [Paenibacillus sp. BAC0078]